VFSPEIKAVKKRLQTQKELEGIDSENIIEDSGRGSRRAAREAAVKVPQYREALESEEEGSEEDEDKDEEDEEFGEEENDEGETLQVLVVM
jgi:hypothetical protein